MNSKETNSIQWMWTNLSRRCITTIQNFGGNGLCSVILLVEIGLYIWFEWQLILWPWMVYGQFRIYLYSMKGLADDGWALQESFLEFLVPFDSGLG